MTLGVSARTVINEVSCLDPSCDGQLIRQGKQDGTAFAKCSNSRYDPVDRDRCMAESCQITANVAAPVTAPGKEVQCEMCNSTVSLRFQGASSLLLRCLHV